MVHYRDLKSIVINMLLFLFTVSIYGQSKNLSKEQMILDIDTLFSTIEKVHPNIYSVYSKQQLETDIEKTKLQLAANGDIFYFYKQIAPLVAKLGDGHTGIYFPFHYLAEKTDILLFPFSIKIDYSDRQILVQSDYTITQNTIPNNAKITSINNRKASDIVQQMINYISGEKNFFKFEFLQYIFTPLLYTLYGDSIFDIDYIYNGNKHSVKVKGISYQDRYEDSQENIISFEPYIFNTFPDKNIGIIEINQFDDINGFKIFLDSTFQLLKDENIENLIIDIRKNSGGDSRLGDELFQYISSVPFSQFGKSVHKYSDILKEFYKVYENQEISEPNGIIEYDYSSELEELKENNLRYKGDIYLLISHFTFSSAASFSWAFKHFNMGTVIGKETGGLAICYGDVITPTLPNSGLYYSISWKKFYFYGATDENIHGTLPDYDIDSEKALDFAIELITQQKKTD
jgi:hypothetical protein